MLESLVAGEGSGGMSKPSWRVRGMEMGGRGAGDGGAVGLGADVEAADAAGVGPPRGEGRGSTGDLAVSRGFSAEALVLMGGAGLTGDCEGSSSSAIGLQYAHSLGVSFHKVGWTERMFASSSLHGI